MFTDSAICLTDAAANHSGAKVEYRARHGGVSVPAFHSALREQRHMSEPAAYLRRILAATVIACALGAVATAEEAPPANTTGLASLGPDWVKVNPYRGDPKAIAHGKSLFAENCARCHGIDAISGGIAPDLRYLPQGQEGDEIFSYRVQNGASKDGRVAMPKWGGVLGQEALWTIRSWLDTVHQE